MFALGTFAMVQGYMYIDNCCKRRYRHGRNTISCALWIQSPVRGALSYCSTIPLASDGVYPGDDKSVGRGPRLFFSLSDISLGMCSEAKVCRSTASLSTVITRQIFGFLWPTAARRTHISATCKFASVPPTRQFAWKAWCSSNTWLQSLDRYQRLALAACTCTQPSQ